METTQGITLSILIPSVPQRFTIMSVLFDKLNEQISKFQDKVELLVLIDNKKRTLGAKRNEMIGLAKGEYVVFIDDDDLVSEDYVESILEAIKEGTDVISFDMLITTYGVDPKPVSFSVHNDHRQDAMGYYRTPNGLMCFKKEIIKKAPFSDITFGEDTEFAGRILPFLKSEHKIEKQLYHYRCVPNKSEC